MLFNSPVFLFCFLPVVWGFAAALRSYAGRSTLIAWLAAASAAFYAYAGGQHLLLLLGSIFFNAAVAHATVSAATDRAARGWRVTGISANLLLLGVVKYSAFAVGNLDAAFGFGWDVPRTILPVGISFYTFTQVAYLADLQRTSKPYGIADYTLFVGYFPHLVAGPILYHRDVIPQFRGPAFCRFDVDSVCRGATLFAFGIGKKVLIADNLGPFADTVFAAADRGVALSVGEAWFGLLAYTFQIYFDFAGYSDMALGLSLAMGVRIPLNFRSPYRATSIIEFWRRWHMSLSVFLRDYVYVTLGGNRLGARRRYANLMATMLLGGLWHGAGWGFIVWGALHGTFLVVNHAWRNWRRAPSLPRWLAGSLTFVAVVCAWAFFRAGTLAGAWHLLSGAAGVNGVALPQSLARISPMLRDIAPGIDWRDIGMFPNDLGPDKLLWVAMVACAGALAFFAPRAALLAGAEHEAASKLPSRAALILAGAVFACSLMQLQRESPFLYFQF